MNIYWDEPKHKEFLCNYDEGNYNNWFLGFTKDWKDKYLPPDESNSLSIFLKDTEDRGKIYKVCDYYTSYHQDALLQNKETFEFEELFSLQKYVYQEHYCSCNRKKDAKELGAIVEDNECEGNRFVIEKIVYDEIPELILYSETISLVECIKLLFI